MAKLRNVEDVYPLSPMQEGMLLHALSAPQEDVLFNQFCYEVSGDLDVERFKNAWRQIVDRHAILRTGFLWEPRSDPLQVVRREVELPIQEFDWSQSSHEEQVQEVEAYKKADRARGFDLKKPPLMRICIARMSPDRFFFIWTSHHLVIDRWCLDTIFGEFYAFYQAGSGRSELRPATPYRNYIEWIQRRDRAAAESFWRRSLSGLKNSTGLGEGFPAKSRVEATARSEAQLVLSAPVTRGIRAFAKSAGVTLGTVVQAGLALAMNRLNLGQDVVFGATVSGRPATLPDTETIVGSLINNLPIRITMSADKRIEDWLKRIQLDQQRRSEFDYVSLAQIHGWSELNPSESLFDTLLVWLSPVAENEAQSPRFSGLAGEFATAYPLTISVQESSESLSFTAVGLPGYRFLAAPAEVLETLGERLETLADCQGEMRLCDMSGFRGEQALADIELHSAAAPRAARRAVAASLVEDVAGGREGATVEALRQLLQSAWSEVLSTDAIRPEDNFFVLGGDSLKAARLHAAIEAALRCKIPMITLFQSPTIQGMAERLASGDWPQTASLVMPVRAQGAFPAMFCIASPEVNTVGYALLARYLDPDKQVHVVQAPPDSNYLRRISPAEIPELAAEYVEAVRQIQPVGPYHLLGMCTGSQTALEMARQITDAGDEVRLVGVINTWALYTVTSAYRILRAKNYARRMLEIATMRPAEASATIRRIVRKRFTGHLRSVQGPASAGSANTDTQSNSDSAASDPWIDEYGWHWKDPGRPKYEGTVTVFRIAPQQNWRTGDRDLGWGRHATRTEVVDLPGTDHNAILQEPNVQYIGEHLRSRQSAIQNNNEKTPATETGPTMRNVFDERLRQS